MLALDGDCGCHWLVVAHGSGDGVMIVGVMVVVYIPSCTTIYERNDDHLITTTKAVNTTVY